MFNARQHEDRRRATTPINLAHPWPGFETLSGSPYRITASSMVCCERLMRGHKPRSNGKRMFTCTTCGRQELARAAT